MSIETIIRHFLFEPSIVIGNVSYVIGLVIACLPFQKKKLHALIQLPVLVLLSFLLTFLFALIPFRMTLDFFLKYLVLGLFYVLYLYFIGHGSIRSLFTVFFYLYGMMFLLGELGGSLPLLVRDLAYGKEIDSVIRNLITAMQIPYSYFLNRHSFSKLKDLPLPSFVFSSLLCLSEICIIFFSTYYIRVNAFTLSLFLFIVFFFLALMNIVSYYMMFHIVKANQDMIRLQAKNFELEKTQELLMISDRNLEKLRELKHDSKNQYAYMKMLLSEKRYDELDSFFEEYGDGILEPISFISSSNAIVSSVLNMEYSKAKALGVGFDCKLAIPSSLPILSTDLSSLLCNLLDNSIQGTKESGEKRPVMIRMREYQRFLYLEVNNPVLPSLTLKQIEGIRTTKKDEEFHGFGRKIIASIVKKYNGTIETSLKDHIYSIKIMLSYPNTEDKED